MSKLDLLNHPLCFRLPDRLTPVTSWHEHMPFAMFLVEILRGPAVELGEPRDLDDVSRDRSGRPVARTQILNHPLAKWCHAKTLSELENSSRAESAAYLQHALQKAIAQIDRIATTATIVCLTAEEAFPRPSLPPAPARR